MAQHLWGSLQNRHAPTERGIWLQGYPLDFGFASQRVPPFRYARLEIIFCGVYPIFFLCFSPSPLLHFSLNDDTNPRFPLFYWFSAPWTGLAGTCMGIISGWISSVFVHFSVACTVCRQLISFPALWVVCRASVGFDFHYFFSRKESICDGSFRGAGWDGQTSFLFSTFLYPLFSLDSRYCTVCYTGWLGRKSKMINITTTTT